MTKWQERIKALQAVGMTLEEIATQISLSPGAVGDLARGRTREPRGDAVLKLHTLHAQKCKASPKATAA